jgi:hypothetical protein
MKGDVCSGGSTLINFLRGCFGNETVEYVKE